MQLCLCVLYLWLPLDPTCLFESFHLCFYFGAFYSLEDFGFVWEPLIMCVCRAPGRWYWAAQNKHYLAGLWCVCRWRILSQQSTSWSTSCWKDIVSTSVQASRHGASSSPWERPQSRWLWIRLWWQTWWVTASNYSLTSQKTRWEAQRVAETQILLPNVAVFHTFISFLDGKQLIFLWISLLIL